MHSNIPSERIAPIVSDWMERFQRDHPASDSFRGNQNRVPDDVIHVMSPLQALVERSGVADRTVRSILRGKYQTVQMRVADSLLCAMEATYLWHMPPENGGLSDIYEVA